MKISKDRWKKAQRVETYEWAHIPNIVENEWNDLKIKYRDIFKNIQQKYKMNKTTKILDLGCGPTCASRLFDKGKKIGIDPLAKELGYEGNIGDVKVISAAAEHLPFKKTSFDIVIATNSIGHMHSPKKALSEANRVLKPHGVLILSCYIYNPFIYLIRDFCETTGFKRNVAHPHTFTLKKITKLLEKKFKIEDVQIIYTGKSPTDYGKPYDVEEQNPFFTNLTLFFNYKILRFNYFVKDVLIITRKI